MSRALEVLQRRGLDATGVSITISDPRRPGNPLLWVNPAQRLFYSLVAAVLVLASWLTSNLGGFLLGLLLGIVGAALAFGWVPHKAPRNGRDGQTATSSSSAPT